MFEITVKLALTGSLIVAGTLILAKPAIAGELAAGRDKAKKCRVCHGADGIAKIDIAPNIGGESHFYLTKQLRAFRAGTRSDLQMSTIAKGLSDEDIDDIAEYYSSIKITHTIPEIPR